MVVMRIILNRIVLVLDQQVIVIEVQLCHCVIVSNVNLDVIIYL